MTPCLQQGQDQTLSSSPHCPPLRLPQHPEMSTPRLFPSPRPGNDSAQSTVPLLPVPLMLRSPAAPPKEAIRVGLRPVLKKSATASAGRGGSSSSSSSSSLQRTPVMLMLQAAHMHKTVLLCGSSPAMIWGRTSSLSSRQGMHWIRTIASRLLVLNRGVHSMMTCPQPPLCTTLSLMLRASPRVSRSHPWLRVEGTGSTLVGPMLPTMAMQRRAKAMLPTALTRLPRRRRVMGMHTQPGMPR